MATNYYTAKRKEPGIFEVSHYPNGYSVKLDLMGIYQEKNLPGVLATVEVLNESGFSISVSQIQDGLGKVTTQTGLKGRWQTIGTSPLVICDTGHNEGGIQEIIRQINELGFNQLHMVLGMVKDKDVSRILSLLPKYAKYYFCQANIPRAMNAEELKLKAELEGLNGIIVKNVNEAIAEAKRNSSTDDFIFVGGSTFVVAEVENL